CRSTSTGARSSGAPIASSSGSALTSDSATSSIGFESQTSPPPSLRWSWPPAVANGRIASASSTTPLPWSRPYAPTDAPRAPGRGGPGRSACPPQHAPGGVGEWPVSRLSEPAQPGSDRAGGARGRRAEVLDEVDLVDGAAPERLARAGDGGGVVVGAPRPSP